MITAPLVIVGMGGFGREVHEIVDAVNQASDEEGQRYDLLGFLDDDPAAKELEERRGISHLGPASTLASLPPEVQYVIAIGSPTVRRRIDEMVVRSGREAATLVHPSAVVGRRGIVLGPGSIVCASAVVATDITFGRHVHVNMGATVGHDAVCRDYVTISPNAAVSGNVELSTEVFVGTGAVIIQDRRVGAGSVVGAGSAVMHDLGPNITAVGVPARAFPGRSARD